MARGELIEKKAAKQWEPFCTLTLSKREAHALRLLLGLMESDRELDSLFDVLSVDLNLDCDGYIDVVIKQSPQHKKLLNDLYGDTP